MPFHINHIHLKSHDPEQTANWYVRAFNLSIARDIVRPAPLSDRFITCRSEDGGMTVNISGPLEGQSLGPGDAQPHLGLEHFGFDSTHLETDLARLQALGAVVLQGPPSAGQGPRIAFIQAPDNVRIELVEVRA